MFENSPFWLCLWVRQRCTRGDTTSKTEHKITLSFHYFWKVGVITMDRVEPADDSLVPAITGLEKLVQLKPSPPFPPISYLLSIHRFWTNFIWNNLWEAVHRKAFPWNLIIEKLTNMIIYHFTFDHHFLDRAGLSSLSSHWSVTGPDPGGDGNFSATRLVFSPPPVIAAQVENHNRFIFHHRSWLWS